MRVALWLLLAAVAAIGVAAQDDAHRVEGFSYLLSTDLAKRQGIDVIRTLDSTYWDRGQTPKGMHKCARLCRREGGGGVCAAWTFCWEARRCQLLSRLPSSLEPAQPSALASALGTSTYNAKCASGYSDGAVVATQLATQCRATTYTNTALGDTMSLTASFRSRQLREPYNANQASAADCCALCESLRDKGCTSWSYDPNGWLIDSTWKCTLRTGTNPAMSNAKGSTSGIMLD